MPHEKPIKKPVIAKKPKKDWRPLLAGGIIFIMVLSTFVVALDYLFPVKTNDQGEQPIDKFGPYDVFKAGEHDYYIKLSSDFYWHFRANPVDTLNVPVFPYRENFLNNMGKNKEMWVAFSPEEDPRVILAASEIAKTAAALNYTVQKGFTNQPKRCVDNPQDDVCTIPILGLEFANENRTVFRILGPKVDSISDTSILAIGHNIIVQGDTYDHLDIAADKASLIMLGLA